MHLILKNKLLNYKLTYSLGCHSDELLNKILFLVEISKICWLTQKQNKNNIAAVSKQEDVSRNRNPMQYICFLSVRYR